MSGDLQTTTLNGVTLFTFAPWRLGIFENPIAPGRTIPIGPNDILPSSGAIAALNGPQYDLCSPGDTDATSQCDLIDFLQMDTNRGVMDPGTRPNEGITISVVSGVAQVTPGGTSLPGASVAVQLWPPLVTGGQNVTSPSLNTENVWRSALCIMNDGNLAFAIGVNSMSAFADALVAAGAVTAGYTDGGGSSHLVMQESTIGASEQRRVASWLIVNQGSIIVPALLMIAGAWVLWEVFRRGRP